MFNTLNVIKPAIIVNGCEVALYKGTGPAKHGLTILEEERIKDKIIYTEDVYWRF